MNSPSSRISRFVTQGVVIQNFHSHHLMTKNPVNQLQKKLLPLSKITLTMYHIILNIDVNYCFFQLIHLVYQNNQKRLKKFMIYKCILVVQEAM